MLGSGTQAQSQTSSVIRFALVEYVIYKEHPNAAHDSDQTAEQFHLAHIALSQTLEVSQLIQGRFAKNFMSRTRCSTFFSTTD